MTRFYWPDGFSIELEAQGKTLLEIAVSRDIELPILATVADGRYRDLQTLVNGAQKVVFFDFTSQIGHSIFGRSLTFLLVVATERLYPKSRVRIEHSLSDGLYCEIDFPNRKHTIGDIRALEEEMWRLVNQAIPVLRRIIPREDAIFDLEASGGIEKAAILRELSYESVTFYTVDGITGYFYGHMVPSTGYLNFFELKPYAAGFVMRYPRRSAPNKLALWREQAKLYQVYAEAERWGGILNCAYVSDLNSHIKQKAGGDIIRVAEALHEKKLVETADLIAKGAGRYRVVLIAGPSSSGKTTFAQRLSVQLRVNGLKPIQISIDDYFVDRNKTPIDEHGNYDFEALEAVNLELFNNHLAELLAGEEIELPHYNFLTGTSEASGRKIQINEEQPIIIEGIHGLNDRLTESVSVYNKFRIYVCPLTQISLDFHNRVPSTETRLIRRIVRDAAFRGHDALKTLRFWPSVRRGEERNIFPFQDNADVMFNSALIYELSILKEPAEDLLKAVPIDEPESTEAIRLLDFLEYFSALQDDYSVPRNSILREFIGGSCFSD